MHCCVSAATMVTRTHHNVGLYVLRYISCFNIHFWIRVWRETCYRGMNLFFRMEFDSVFAEEYPGPTFSIECISVGIDVGEVRVRKW